MQGNVIAGYFVIGLMLLAFVKKKKSNNDTLFNVALLDIKICS